MSDLATLLGLDPFRTETVLSSPLLEHVAQPDHVKEGLLAAETPDRGAVVGVEVAMDGYAALLGEGYRLFDLPPLKVLFAH